MEAAKLSNEDLALLIFEALNTRDLALLDERLDAEAVFDFPGPGRIQGARKIKVFFKVLFKKYRDLTFTVHDMLVDGDRACVVWTNTGTDAGGGGYSNSGVTYIRFVDGRITFLSDYFKDTSFAGRV